VAARQEMRRGIFVISPSEVSSGVLGCLALARFTASRSVRFAELYEFVSPTKTEYLQHKPILPDREPIRLEARNYDHRRLARARFRFGFGALLTLG
jgi:hypothetical protein